jgi:hypothetical protein
MSRPILPWRSPLVVLPLGSREVWIRRIAWFDRPVIATTDTTDIFTVLAAQPEQTPPTVAITVPAIQVHTWKYRFLADEEEHFPPA